IHDLAGLSEIRVGVRPDLFLREHRPGLGLTGRVPDPRGEVPDDQDGDMTGILELPELPEDDGMSEGEVRTAGVDAEFDAERPFLREPFLQPARRNEVDAPARERRRHVGGHGAAMLPVHLPDPAGYQGYTRPR